MGSQPEDLKLNLRRGKFPSLFFMKFVFKTSGEHIVLFCLLGGGGLETMVQTG